MKKNNVILIALLVVILGVIILRGLLPGSTPASLPEANQEGQNASTLAQELYQLRNPYIGDASANGRILQVLLLQDETGPFHMALETVERPYVLQVIFDEMPEDTDKMDELLSRQGFLIVALIDNADAVQFTYPLETGEEPVLSAVRVSKEALYETLGMEENALELTPEVLDQLLAL